MQTLPTTGSTCIILCTFHTVIIIIVVISSVKLGQRVRRVRFARSSATANLPPMSAGTHSLHAVSCIFPELFALSTGRRCSVELSAVTTAARPYVSCHRYSTRGSATAPSPRRTHARQIMLIDGLQNSLRVHAASVICFISYTPEPAERPCKPCDHIRPHTLTSTFNQ